MRPYKQLDLEERRKIETWRAAKVSVDVIAERLGRHKSTIFREIKRSVLPIRQAQFQTWQRWFQTGN